MIVTVFFLSEVLNFSLCLFGSGGEYDGDRKMDDLKLLYKAYVSDALSGGRMEDEKVCRLLKAI